jgi:hypothetical protein
MFMRKEPVCVNCGIELPGSHAHRKYCSRRCKGQYYKKNPSPSHENGHKCRICGKHFNISSGQYNKWLCSPECRRTSVAKSTREFYLREPEKESLYRARTKAKVLPEGNLTRFRRNNPNAPMECESCGERRVLDVAHKPNHARNGEWRNSQNCKWPEMVWVLCPTCHALIDRMHYPPEELGLKL